MINLSTFKHDHIIRDEKGLPLGRVILKDDSQYKSGMDAIPVVLLKMPTSISVLGLRVFIDGIPYQIPKDLDSTKLSQRGLDFVITNFYLRRMELNG